MPATLTANEKRRSSFGSALTKAMRLQRLTQSELGEMLGDIGQSSISAWTTGNALPPDVETVFALERALRLPPGHLSKHLGFLPAKLAMVPNAVRADDRLDDDGQRIMLTTYKDLVAAAKRRHPTAHKPAAVRERRRTA